jgi:alpha-tubulin suppressor-like RCC1 family protein
MRCFFLLLLIASAVLPAEAQEPDSTGLETLQRLFEAVQRAGDQSQDEEPTDTEPAPAEPTAAPIAWSDFGIDGAVRCGVDLDGQGWCWSPRAGVMGTGEDPMTMRSRTPKRVAGGHTFTSVSVDGDFVCALDDTGRAWCWGRNGSANLGDGTINYRLPERAPIPVKTDRRFHTILTNDFGACGLDDEDRLHCWGGGNDKLLSIGPDPMSRVPVPYMSDFQWKQLSLTGAGFCGVTRDGTGYCWGRSNGYGLGNGEWGSKERPTPIAGNFTWKEVHRGMSHTCGLTTDGRAYCWGSGSDGRLGHDGAQKGDPEQCPRHPFVCAAKPMPVDTDVRFTELKVTLFTNCGLDAEGRAWCWGGGDGGTLGDGIVDSRDHSRQSVAPVETDVRFRTLRMQGRQACGISKADDQVWCWGHLFEKTGVPTPAPVPTPEAAADTR